MGTGETKRFEGKQTTKRKVQNEGSYVHGRRFTFTEMKQVQVCITLKILSHRIRFRTVRYDTAPSPRSHWNFHVLHCTAALHGIVQCRIQCDRALSFHTSCDSSEDADALARRGAVEANDARAVFAAVSNPCWPRRVTLSTSFSQCSQRRARIRSQAACMPCTENLAKFNHLA